MRFLLVIVGLLTWQALHINGKSTQENCNDEPNNDDDRALSAVTHSANQFAFNTFERFSRDISGNGVWAPCEYFFSMWATTYGTEQHDLDKLSEMLSLRTVDYDILEYGLRALVTQIGRYNSIDLSWNNKLYYHSGLEPTTNFRDAMWSNFLTEAEALDFHAQTEASKVINEWFANATNNLVPNIVQPDDLTEDTSLALVNAIYFKGKWATPIRSIHDDVFHVTRSTEILVPFTQQLGFFYYGELHDVNAKFIGIEYEVINSEDGMSMFIILPNEVDGLAELVQNIKNISLSQLLRGGVTEMELRMPTFSIENKIVASKPFADWQKPDVLGDGAHSTGQTNNPRHKISKFIHKVVIDVDAGPASNLINASPTPGTPTFIVDRPFVCIIASTGKNPAVLLMARYTGSEYSMEQ